VSYGADEGKIAADSLVAQISAFYQAYAEAFHARSGTQIADFYCTPCISIRGDASIHWFQSRPETEKFFQGYYEEGLRRSEARNLEVVPIGGRALLATVDWVFYRGDGTLLKQWRQSYNLVRTDGRWQILLSTFHVA
jgi:ketosteroid isomerase-like protein